MPVDFLAEEQKQRYGRYTSEPSPTQLSRYFHLDVSDREQVQACRGIYNKLSSLLGGEDAYQLRLILVAPSPKRLTPWTEK
jgi:Domain of unknown function (DUF4158)